MRLMRMRATGWLGAVIGAAALIAGAGSANAAGGDIVVLDKDWSFEGPFGMFDQAQLQRGWQVYSEVCAACHGMQFLSFRDLGAENGPAFPPEQVKAIAENFIHQVPTVDEFGEATTRPATPADKIPGPYTNEEAAKAANGGAIPPDLTLMTKARTGYTGIITQIFEGVGGPEYTYSILLGYQDQPPEGFEVQGVLNYNKYFPGHQIAMAQPLWGDDVTYQDGTAATIEQQAADVTAFMTWAAEPHMTDRKQAGVLYIILFIGFAALLWFSNKKLWAPVKKGA